MKLFKILSLLIFSCSLFAVEKHYELRVHNTVKNFTGVNVDHALAINGSIPAPTLRFKLGDIVVIKVINETNEPTTLHWHGLLVPWKQDGPQFANSRIIEPGKTQTFRFPIRHTGTYWYHSHTQLQEQRGLYGAIVIEDEHQKHQVDHDFVFVMSDWINEKPLNVLANLKKDGDYYKYKKDFLPSILGALRHGAIWDYIKSEWTRMGPMDLSDVGYDAFLINGKIKSMLKNVKHGEKVRFRVINASASTYFYFNIGKLRNFTVIAKDGVDVQPVTVNELLVGIAETYDVIFEVPHMMKMFEAKATAQDITGSASLMFGMGDMEHVPMKMKPSPYGMGHMDHGGGHDDHDDEPGDGDDDGPGDGDGDHDDHLNTPKDIENQLEDELMLYDLENGMGTPMPKTKRLNYKMLKSLTPTDFDKNLVRAQVIELELSGDMERYNWYINGKPFSEEKYINIKENEVITFKFINKTMMHHPMHLHGHFFRALMGQGNFSPLFHTVDVAPMKTVTIEFHANEPGIWFLHCHNLYHMKMGMARLVKYEGFEQTPELKADEAKWGPLMTHDDDGYWRGQSSVYSNKAKFEFGLNAGRYQVDIELEVDEFDFGNVEAEVMFKKYYSKFLSAGAGVIYEDQKVYAALTAAYTLPGNFEVEGYIRHDGKAVVKLSKTLPITSRVSIELEPLIEYYKNQLNYEFETTLQYRFNERWSLDLNYNYNEEDDHTVGIGFTFRF